MGIESKTVATGHLLKKLRCLMKENGIHFYIVPSGDEHSSEYISESDARRAFISGFDGSAGCAVISETQALMFTDGRYFLQASQQLDKNWTLMKLGLPGVLTWQKWIIEQAKEGKTVGVDARLISFSKMPDFYNNYYKSLTSFTDEAMELSKELGRQSNAELIGFRTNLIDEVWGREKPQRPCNPVIVHPIEFAGMIIHSSFLLSLILTLD
ncbi:hypothetical protein PCANB_001134 [Pneumocystis canis]|nr:hypothetical protein PCANB_001134 [Pneumocystis canis]